VIADICSACGGHVAMGTTRHLDRARCGDPAPEIVRVTPQQGESMIDALVREVMANRKP